MKPFTPGEFVLTAWVASLYAFSADSSRVWISSVAAVLMLGIAGLEIQALSVSSCDGEKRPSLKRCWRSNRPSGENSMQTNHLSVGISLS
jgi:hypothetical protein